MDAICISIIKEMKGDNMLPSSVRNFLEDNPVK